MIGGNDRDKSTGPGKPILRRDDFPDEDVIAPPIRPQRRTPAAVGRGLVDRAGPPRGPGASAFAESRLAPDDEDRLPWLESPDELDGGEGAFDSGRLVGFIVVTLVALGLIAAAVWLVVSRASGPGPADGSLVRAEPGPYKVRPDRPGGETFEGTGDSSFAVSEGQTRGAKLASEDSTDDPTASSPARSGGPDGSDAATAAVQVGAYMTEAQAEASWPTLVQRHAALASLHHRVVEGTADMSTVYRLQAVTANSDAANALCATLKAAGQDCQVKR
jgi:hypothetical protein